MTDNEGLVLGALTTKSSVNEVGNLEEVLDIADLLQDTPLITEKGYQSKKNAALLKYQIIRFLKLQSVLWLIFLAQPVLWIHLLLNIF